jgi:hypothetical protein
MWLYPLPALIAIVLWFSIMLSTGWKFALSGLGMTLLGIIVYFIREQLQKKI